MKINYDKLLQIFEVLPYALVFLFTLRFPLDSDLGWHLRQGEYFIQNHKILDINILSLDMVNFQYTNHSWLSDIFIYLIFNNFSFWGLALLSSIIFTLVYYFFSKALSLDFWQKSIIFPIIIYLSYISTEISFRTQSFSLLFLSLLIYLLTKLNSSYKKYIFLITILNIVWVNLHGEFILGPITVTVWTFCVLAKNYIKNKKFLIKENKNELMLTAIVYIATLINPYSYKIYGFVFEHFFNQNLINKITEWVSPLTVPQLIPILLFSVLIYLTSVFILYFRKDVINNLFFIILPVPFMLESILHARYLWIFIILLFPLMVYLVNVLRPKKLSSQLKISFIILLPLYLLSIITIFNVKAFTKPDWDSYCIYNKCSANAAEYLIKNLKDKKIYTQFYYGGWLIWNFPQIKPVVDGRMHAWREKNGYSAFENSYALEFNQKYMNDTKYDVVFIGKNKALYQQMNLLVKAKQWEKLFEDNFMVIYKRI